MQKLSLFIALLVLQTSLNFTYAEKADGMKPLRIWAESQTYDGNKKTTVYTGTVRMEKGTLAVNASRLEIVEDAHGGKLGILYGSPGKLVSFRQKRDGGPDLWAEGEAEKVVYDDDLELIKLYNQAKLVLLDGKKHTHESAGIYISYDSRTDFMSVNNTVRGVSSPGAGFTNAVIYPATDKEKTSSSSAPSATTKKEKKEGKLIEKARETPLEKDVAPSTMTTKDNVK